VRRLFIFLLAVVGFNMASVQSHAGGPVAVGYISVRSSADVFEISATVEARSANPAEVKATFLVTKNDASGNVTTRQAKSIEITQDNATEIAQTNVSMGVDGLLEVSLIIEENDVIVDRVTHTVSRNHQD